MLASRLEDPRLGKAERGNQSPRFLPGKSAIATPLSSFPKKKSIGSVYMHNAQAANDGSVHTTVRVNMLRVGSVSLGLAGGGVALARSMNSAIDSHI